MQVFVRAKICPDPCKRGLKFMAVTADTGVVNKLGRAFS